MTCTGKAIPQKHNRQKIKAVTVFAIFNITVPTVITDCTSAPKQTSF